MGFRSAVSRTLVLTVLAVLVGAVAALLWANLAVLPEWTVQADGHAEISDSGRAEMFSASFWYSILAMAGVPVPAAMPLPQSTTIFKPRRSRSFGKVLLQNSM